VYVAKKKKKFKYDMLICFFPVQMSLQAISGSKWVTLEYLIYLIITKRKTKVIRAYMQKYYYSLIRWSIGKMHTLCVLHQSLIKHFVIKFVSDYYHVSGFLLVFQFPPLIKTDRHDIVESVV
jgi:hypothetical protein